MNHTKNSKPNKKTIQQRRRDSVRKYGHWQHGTNDSPYKTLKRQLG